MRSAQACLALRLQADQELQHRARPCKTQPGDCDALQQWCYQAKPWVAVGIEDTERNESRRTVVVGGEVQMVNAKGSLLW